MAALACVYDAAPAPRRAARCDRRAGRPQRRTPGAARAACDRDVAGRLGRMRRRSSPPPSIRPGPATPPTSGAGWYWWTGDRHQIELTGAGAARRKAAVHLVIDPGGQRGLRRLLGFPPRPGASPRPSGPLPGRLRPYRLIEPVTVKEPHPSALPGCLGPAPRWPATRWGRGVNWGGSPRPRGGPCPRSPERRRRSRACRPGHPGGHFSPEERC